MKQLITITSHQNSKNFGSCDFLRQEYCFSWDISKINNHKFDENLEPLFKLNPNGTISVFRIVSNIPIMLTDHLMFLCKISEPQPLIEFIHRGKCRCCSAFTNLRARNIMCKEKWKKYDILLCGGINLNICDLCIELARSYKTTGNIIEKSHLVKNNKYNISSKVNHAIITEGNVLYLFKNELSDSDKALSFGANYYCSSCLAENIKKDGPPYCNKCQNNIDKVYKTTIQVLWLIFSLAKDNFLPFELSKIIFCFYTSSS